MAVVAGVLEDSELIDVVTTTDFGEDGNEDPLGSEDGRKGLKIGQSECVLVHYLSLTGLSF